MARNCSCLVGPPDPAPGAADAGQLAGLVGGEVAGVLQQRPAGTLERFGVAGVGKLAELLPQVASDLVEGVADQFHEVEHISAHDGLGSVALGLDGGQVRRSEVHRDRCELGGTLGSEVVEELVEGLGVFAFGPPDDPTPVMVDDQGQVLVVLPPGDLIDPDTEQAIQAARFQLGGHDPFAGPAHGPPRHPTQPGDRGLVHPGRQPGQQVIEVPGQMGPGPSEGDGLDDHPMGRAPQAP